MATLADEICLKYLVIYWKWNPTSYYVDMHQLKPIIVVKCFNAKQLQTKM